MRPVVTLAVCKPDRQLLDQVEAVDVEFLHAGFEFASLAQVMDNPLRSTLAVGDGANDLPMLEAAGLGVAFRAKPAVAERAVHRIDHCDLTALLYAQGYRAAEFSAV